MDLFGPRLAYQSLLGFLDGFWFLDFYILTLFDWENKSNILLGIH